MQKELETIQTMIDYTPKLITGIEEFVDEIRENYNQEQKIKLIEIIDGLQWFIGAISVVKELLREDIEENELVIIFQGMLEAMENEDNMLLADLLEYELIIRLEEWNKVMLRSNLDIM